MYLDHALCDFVVSVADLSRSNGVNKAHATAVAACTWGPRVSPSHTKCGVLGFSHSQKEVAARSRSYGVQKAHATAVAPCTRRTHEPSSCTMSENDEASDELK